MHTARLKLLAAHIRKLPHDTERAEYITSSPLVKHRLNGFNMDYIAGWTSCGTAGCIAGHACSLFGSTNDPDLAFFSLGEAEKLLLLTRKEARNLFLPQGCDLTKITPAEAAEACLRVADGKEPWPIWNR